MGYSRIANATAAVAAVVVLSAFVGTAMATQAVTAAATVSPAASARSHLPTAAIKSTPKAVDRLTPAAMPQSVSRDNAREMALSYLEYTAFSRTGLIKQLQFEGFSKSDATYGADATHANWYKQAALMAAAYLDYSSFSRRGLIEQLKYEGFTTSQATYGAKSVGL